MRDVTICLIAVRTMVVFGMPEFSCNRDVPSSTLLDKFEQSYVRSVVFFVGAVGQHAVHFVQILCCFACVCFGCCACVYCDTSSRWPELVVWSFQDGNGWPPVCVDAQVVVRVFRLGRMVCSAVPSRACRCPPVVAQVLRNHFRRCRHRCRCKHCVRNTVCCREQGRRCWLV